MSFAVASYAIVALSRTAASMAIVSSHPDIAGVVLVALVGAVPAYTVAVLAIDWMKS